MDKSLVITGILFVLFGVTYGRIFRQDYYYNQRGEGWFKFYTKPTKWIDAVMTCFDDGAVLASPINEEIRYTLNTMMIDQGVTATPIFTGIHNTYTESEYQSMEGVFLSNLNLCWSTEPTELTLVTQRHSIAMNSNGTVTAVFVNTSHPFICYRKAGTERNECGPVDKGYTFYNRTGSCYKAVNKLVTWPEAFKICAREGAHLAIINSQAEAEVMVELANKVHGESPKALYNYVNIGFYLWGTKPQAKWVTIHGQSLDDAGYSKWAPKEPNETDRCGAMSAGGTRENGVLDDADCAYKRKFICEIEPQMETISTV